MWFKKEKAKNASGIDTSVAVMNYGTATNGELSPTAKACSDFLWKLSFGADYDFSTDAVDSATIADAVISILNYGLALFSIGSKGRLTCVDPTGAMLNYNAYGNPISGSWLGYDKTMRTVDLVIPGMSDGIIKSYADILDLENILYRKAGQVVKNLGITGLLVKVKGIADPGKIQAIADKFRSLSSTESSACTLVCDEDVEVLPYNNVSLDALIPDSKLTLIRDMVCAIYSVNPDVLWASSSNRATIEQASENVFRFAIYPIAYYICEKLTENGYQIMPKELVKQEINQNTPTEEIVVETNESQV